jgi:hypothetical protein
MNFNTWGPFEIAIGKDDRLQFDQFWQSVDRMEQQYGSRGLRSAIGCYLFTTKRGTKFTPWYVGKTVAHGGFECEIFQQHKINHYKNFLGERRRRSGHIFLFALITESNDWRFSKRHRSATKIIDWLEKMMIGMVISKNGQAVNSRDTKFLREMWVEGILNHKNPGAPTSSARAARNALC